MIAFVFDTPDHPSAKGPYERHWGRANKSMAGPNKRHLSTMASGLCHQPCAM
jgi:hypothetical protein